MPNKRIDYDKLQDSLEYIKSICEENQDSSGGGCFQCPLSADGLCMLRKRPKDWTIRHPETDVFRVLG